MYVSRAGVSTMGPVITPVILVRPGQTPVQSAEAWELIFPQLKVKKRMSIFNTGTTVTRPGSVWMTLLQRDCSPGWMGALINFATGLKNNQTTLGGRTACTLLVLDMDTCGMTWTVLPVISIRVKKVGSNFCYLYTFWHWVAMDEAVNWRYIYFVSPKLKIVLIWKEFRLSESNNWVKLSQRRIIFQGH